jgi:hypothetical protein
MCPRYYVNQFVFVGFTRKKLFFFSGEAFSSKKTPPPQTKNVVSFLLQNTFASLPNAKIDLMPRLLLF